MNRAASIFCALIITNFTSASSMAQIVDINSQPELASEISVTSDAWSWVSPNTVRITVRIESSGASATEAAENLQRSSSAIRETIKQTNISDLTFIDRGKEMRGANAQHNSISSGEIVKAIAHLGIETSEVSKAHQVIDAALNAGAHSISDVDYLVRDVEAARVQAISHATHRGKLKAQAIAKSLNVKLGKLIAATTTEESEGRILRRNQQLGKNLGNYSDQEIHVIVNLRYTVRMNSHGVK